MRLPTTCKECEDYSRIYGCIDSDCEVYVDVKAEADYEDMRDTEREE